MDAAAEFHGISLNKELLTGPDLLNLLVGVIMRFCVHPIAIAADIEAMFHQVRTSAEDADSLRFLWEGEVYQTLVHVFGKKDSPTIANYVVKRTARDNHDKFSALAFESALRAFYVDDYLKSVSTVEEAAILCTEMVGLMNLGGMKLCKFQSNCKEALEKLPANALSPSATRQIEDESQLDRALGIIWDAESDCFTFQFHVLDLPASKRGILKTAAKLFDPLGWVLPFTLVARIIIQLLWRLGCDWDELIDDETKKQWEQWLEGAKQISRVKIPRQFIKFQDRSVTSVQLHVFCDASEDAYGCCAYVRFSFKTGEHESRLVMAKSRLAPIKTVSLPKLETNGA